MRYILLFCLAIPCSSRDEDPWTSLLDKDLTQWDSYLSYKHKIGYNGEQPVDDQGNPLSPIGLNNDGNGVFSVIEEKGESVLKISGEIYGCLITKQEYKNYHLRLQVKWGDKKWDPRKEKLKDSGIMYHSIGDLGTDYWRTWMLSQEFQVMEGHMGDYWSQQTSAIDIRAYKPESRINPIADEKQPFLPFGKGEEIPGFCLREMNRESAHGDWTVLELICYEGRSLHIVNGHVVMALKNSRYLEQERSIPLVKGKIQLQSEAAEVYYKGIEIKKLESFPNQYSSYFED